MRVEQSVGENWQRKLQVPGENLPQWHFVYHNPTWRNPGWTLAAMMGSRRLTSWTVADQIKDQLSDTRNSHKILIGRSERKRLLGRSRCKGDIKINLKQQNICKGVNWIHPAQDRNQCRYLVNTLINLLVSYKARYLVYDYQFYSNLKPNITANSKSVNKKNYIIYMRIYSTASRPALGPNWYRGLSPRGLSSWGVKLNTHLHLVLRSRMMELYLRSP
jgi:hypothetical protein